MRMPNMPRKSPRLAPQQPMPLTPVQQAAINGAHVMYTELTLVTPEMATVWLEKNTINRPLRQGHINDLRDKILAGQMLPTHQGIAFSVDGTLIDGQHRLWAVVEAKMPTLMNVTYNAPLETFDIIDIGRKRTVGDVTGTHSQVPAIARALMLVAYNYKGTKHRAEEIELTKLITPYYEQLKNACSYIKRGLTQSAIQAAVITYLVTQPHRSEEMLQKYHDFVMGELSNRPPKLMRLYTHVLETPQRNSNMQDDLYARACNAFAVSMDNSEKKIQIKSMDMYRALAKATIDGLRAGAQ